MENKNLPTHPKNDRPPTRGSAPRNTPAPEPSPKERLKNFLHVRLEALSTALRALGVRIFYGRERILCGTVLALLMIFFALIETTVFSTLRPFGAIPDLMISFVAALAVSEGRRFGAVYGIIAAVVIESLGVCEVMLLPMLYMLTGFIVGILCRYYITDSIVVRLLISLSILPPRGIFTAVYTAISPVGATAGETFFEIILPEATATLLLALPVHLIVYLCMRPFHRTRAEKVER